MKNILVPCDFSKPAVNAFRFAIDLAKKTKGVVYAIHIVELPAISDPVLMPVAAFEKDFMSDLKEKTESRFEKLISKYNSAGVEIKTEVAFGAPFRVIEEKISKRKIDLVVMGTHGATGIREYLIGSNAEKVVRRSKVPVLVLKDYYRGPIKDIVFPNTLETEKQEKELQAFFKAKLHIVYVNTPTNFTADDITTERLKRFVQRYGIRNYTLNVYNYPFEESGIIQFTKNIKGDLIAMRTHGRQGLAHFLNGSLAEDVVNHADRPIWTFAC
jgi:nucleotide-binding universal stress UspA family protein